MKEGLLLPHYFLCWYCAQSHRIFTLGKISTEPLSLSDNARLNAIKYVMREQSTVVLRKINVYLKAGHSTFPMLQKNQR